MQELKPCPLCGTEAIAIQPGSGGPCNVGCGVEDSGTDSCGLVLFGGDRDEVIDRWNTRAEVDLLAGALRDIVKHQTLVGGTLALRGGVVTMAERALDMKVKPPR